MLRSNATTGPRKLDQTRRGRRIPRVETRKPVSLAPLSPSPPIACRLSSKAWSHRLCLRRPASARPATSRIPIKRDGGVASPSCRADDAVTERSDRAPVVPPFRMQNEECKRDEGVASPALKSETAYPHASPEPPFSPIAYRLSPNALSPPMPLDRCDKWAVARQERGRRSGRAFRASARRRSRDASRPDIPIPQRRR
jgi:hypothetical protein